MKKLKCTQEMVAEAKHLTDMQESFDYSGKNASQTWKKWVQLLGIWVYLSFLSNWFWRFWSKSDICDHT